MGSVRECRSKRLSTRGGFLLWPLIIVVVVVIVIAAVIVWMSLVHVSIVEERFLPSLRAQRQGEMWQDDAMPVYFKVRSDALTGSTYDDLSAKLVSTTDVRNLTITPTTQKIDPIGPHGTTIDYSFTLYTENTPVGDYKVKIVIMSGNQEVASKELSFTVSRRT